MKWDRGFKRLTLVLSILTGPFLLFYIIATANGASYWSPIDIFISLLIFGILGFVTVWIIYWIASWIVTGFIDDKQKTQIFEESVIKATKISLISIVLLYVAIHFYDIYQRRQVELINPDVTIAFEIINMRVMLLAEQGLIDKEEYKQYMAVRENIDYPFGSMEYRKAEYKYYDFLTRLGFKLPPYKLKQPVTQAHRITFSQDYSRLREAKAMFVEGITDAEEKEIEGIIEETSKRYSVDCDYSLKDYID